MTDPDQQTEEERPVLSSLRRLGLALTLPLVGAALLWWLPSSQTQTIVVSLVVIAVALTGWWYWREDE